MWRRARTRTHRSDRASRRRLRGLHRRLHSRLHRGLRSPDTPRLRVCRAAEAPDLCARQHCAAELHDGLEDHGVGGCGVAFAAHDDARLGEVVEGDRGRGVVRRETADERDVRVVEEGSQVERELAVAVGLADACGEHVGERLRGIARESPP